MKLIEAARGDRLSRHLDRLAWGVIVSGLGVAYAGTISPSLTWANQGADGGDLVTAAATLGVAHPTGYPTYLLLARFFQLLPFGDLAFRTNLLSASAAIGAALTAYAVARAMLPREGWIPATAAGLAGLGLGLSSVLWSQAVVAEVYTLNALFVGLILWFTLRVPVARSEDSNPWPGMIQPLVIGLALGNHVTAAIPAAGYMASVLIHTPARERWRALARVLGWIALGLLVYLYLPVRAAAHPPVNWGDPVDWDGFWWVFSGEPYRQLAFGLPQTFLADRVGAWASLLIQQFGPAGLILGFFGLFYGRTDSKSFLWLTVGIATLYSVFAIFYNTRDSQTYLIPFYLVFAIWIGLGAAAVLEWVRGRNARWAPVLAIVLAAGLLWGAPATAGQVSAREDREAVDYATGILEQAPGGSVVLTTSDRDTFSLWYFHYALGRRPDLFVIVEPLLEFEWYRANLRAVYPSLRVPEPMGVPWREALASSNGSLASICRTGLDGEPSLRCDGP